MPIVVNVDVMLARRKMRLNTLAELVGITAQNLSVLKTGRALRDEITAPVPCRTVTKPSSCNCRYATATVFRFTPRSPATCRTEGSVIPSRSSPRAIKSLIPSVIC